MVEIIFGNILREIRTERKISQEKLAEYCGLDKTFISLLERGLRQPTITTIFKIAKALDISPSDLIRRIEDQNED